jgi:intracellular multiplication protein IcmK
MKRKVSLKISGFILVLYSLIAFAQIPEAPPLESIPAPPTKNSDLEQQVKQLRQLLAQASAQPAPGGAALTTKSENAENQPEASQDASSQQAPTVTTKEPPDMYEEAFSNVLDQMLPMTPQQIAHLRQAFNEAQRAAATPAGTPPKPTSSSVVVNLAPQATPPVIRLQAGYITSLVFMDSTGQPWPIAAYSLGDPTAFNIQWDKKGNTLLVQSVTFYKRSNLAVILKGLNTPVMLTLLPGQEAVDYRVDLRVPGLGPNAMFMQSGVPEGVNPILIDVLNGIPPKNSKTLRVSREDCQAWLLNKTLFLRTNLDVISPAWRSVMTSMDGTHAYELQPAPVILVIEHGKDKIITLTIDGWE